MFPIFFFTSSFSRSSMGSKDNNPNSFIDETKVDNLRSDGDHLSVKKPNSFVNSLALYPTTNNSDSKDPVEDPQNVSIELRKPSSSNGTNIPKIFIPHLPTAPMTMVLNERFNSDETLMDVVTSTF